MGKSLVYHFVFAVILFHTMDWDSGSWFLFYFPLTSSSLSLSFSLFPKPHAHSLFPFLSRFALVFILVLASEALSCGGVIAKAREGCSGSYRLAVGFLLIKDESISERPG